MVPAVSPSAIHAIRWPGLTAMWCAPRPTQRRSTIRSVESWITDTVPTSSLISAHSPSGVMEAISGVWNLCRTATGPSLGQERIVTVPAAGLQMTTGPVGAAASVVGSPATRTRRSSRPVIDDTSNTACSVSAVTTARAAPRAAGCAVVDTELSVPARVLVLLAGSAVGVDPAVELQAVPEHTAIPTTRRVTASAFMTHIRPPLRSTSGGANRLVIRRIRFVRTRPRLHERALTESLPILHRFVPRTDAVAR
jgi:hypothetical protein